MEQQASLAVLQQYLAKEDILIVRPAALSEADRKWLADEFDQAIFPVLTPLSIDPAHPFPFIPNLGFSMALQLVSKHGREPMTALLRLPPALDRFVRLPDAGNVIRYITLEDVVEHLHPPALSRLSDARDPEPSASSVTAISRSRKRPKIWCASSRPR